MVKTIHRVLLISLIALCLGLPFFAIAQDDQDDAKSIKAERFVKGRPADQSGSSSTYRRTNKPSSPTVRAKGMDLAQLGITIWRFRSSQATDKTKELVEEEEGRQSETLERVEEGTALSPGQRV